MMSKNIQLHYMFSQKCLIRDLLSDVFFYENLDFPQFYCFQIFRACGRGSKTSTDIVRYLYSSRGIFVLQEAQFDSIFACFYCKNI